MKKIIAVRTTLGDPIPRATTVNDTSIGKLFLIVPQTSRNIHTKHGTRVVLEKYSSQVDDLPSIPVSDGRKILPVTLGEYILHKAQNLVDHCNSKKVRGGYWNSPKGIARLEFLRKLLGPGEVLSKDESGTYKIDLSKVKFPKFEEKTYRATYDSLSADVRDSKQKDIKDILAVLRPEVITNNIERMRTYLRMPDVQEYSDFLNAIISVKSADISALVADVRLDSDSSGRHVGTVLALLNSPPDFSQSFSGTSISAHGVQPASGPTFETTIGNVLDLYSRVATAILLQNDKVLQQRVKDSFPDPVERSNGLGEDHVLEPDVMEGSSVRGGSRDSVSPVGDLNTTTSTGLVSSVPSAARTAWTEPDSNRDQLLALSDKPLDELKSMRGILYGLLRKLATTSDDAASSVSRSSGSTRTQTKFTLFDFEAAFIKSAQITFKEDDVDWKGALKAVLENPERLDPEKVTGWRVLFTLLTEKDSILRRVALSEQIEEVGMMADIEGLKGKTFLPNRLALSPVNQLYTALNGISAEYHFMSREWVLSISLEEAANILGSVIPGELAANVLSMREIGSTEELRIVSSLIMILTLVKPGLGLDKQDKVECIEQLCIHLDRLQGDFKKREALVNRLDAQVTGILDQLKDVERQNRAADVYEIDFDVNMLQNIQALFSAENIQHYDASRVLDSRIAEILESEACLHVFPFGTKAREALRPLLDKIEVKRVDEEKIFQLMQKPIVSLSGDDLRVLSPLLVSLEGLSKEEADGNSIVSFDFTDKFKQKVPDFLFEILQFQHEQTENMDLQAHTLHTHGDIHKFIEELRGSLTSISGNEAKVGCLGEDLRLAVLAFVGPVDGDRHSIGGGMQYL